MKIELYSFKQTYISDVCKQKQKILLSIIILMQWNYTGKCNMPFNNKKQGFY